MGHVLKGKVEFIRFTQEGEIDRRIFRYNAKAASNTRNPLLSSGDLIRPGLPLRATLACSMVRTSRGHLFHIFLVQMSSSTSQQQAVPNHLGEQR